MLSSYEKVNASGVPEVQGTTNAQLASPPYAWSLIDLANDLTVSASLEGGGGGSTSKHIDSHFEGISDGRFSKSDVGYVNDQFAMVVPKPSSSPMRCRR